SGMPDFDQKQDNWMKGGQWTFCGPVAVANCFWWFDSKYADPTGTPGDGADIFPLVQNYGAPTPVWGSDDHDPANVNDLATMWPIGNELVERLAYCMDTDGMRTGGTRYGTDVHEMEQCIDNWLNATGLNHRLYEHTVKMPEFEYIVEEVHKSQDVILLLGFWEWQEGYDWVRIGGHYVTVAGVNSTPPSSYPWIGTIAISDPFFDNAEATGFGRVLPDPHGYPHGPTVHNDALYVSHDHYWVLHVPFPGEPPEMSPGGYWELVEYAFGYPPDWVLNFAWMNCPEEFEPMQGEWLGGPIYTEVEYAVLISPLPPIPFVIDGWVNCTDDEPANNPSVTVTNLNTTEVFIAATSASSNYYQVVTSSYNVSAGNVLHFIVSKGNSTEFNHTITEAEMCAGGFTQNATIECGGPAGTCGDCDGFGGLSTNDGWMIFMNLTYKGDPRYLLADTWAADCDGFGGLSTNDGWMIFMNLTYKGDPRYLLKCA
ncbi:MAG: hypothetical protein KAU52_10210, partial [Methanosarcinales archaeon]|nr:hypothetical protein [Methanosarcinales archaeon]